jgi:glycine hydroxymethyltransferase
MLERIKKSDPRVYQSITHEIKRQRQEIELIASENFAPLSVMDACGTPLTNKYAEGYPRARWYGGCDFVDQVEDLARERFAELFGADHVNVQPHSGTQANMAVMLAMLKPGDTILAMDLACGGHLSHGHPLNFSGKIYDIIPYGVDKETECLDYKQIERLAVENKPKLIIAGASAYPGIIDFKQFRNIADKVGAYLLVDMAHFAGLVAAGIYPNPCPHADFVTSTTHKTLRGPRGGFILSRGDFAKKIDTAVFPGVQGGPLMHIIAAKAIAAGLALKQDFVDYQKQIVANARCFAKALAERGYRIVAGGTESHLLLVDLRPKGLTGKAATEMLGKANITVNKNLIPFDDKSPFVTSGIRIGTPAITSRGLKTEDIEVIVDFIDKVLSQTEDATEIKEKVIDFITKFPLYPELKI